MIKNLLKFFKSSLEIRAFPTIIEEPPLHRELFNLEHLKRHAKAFALTHEVAAGPGPDQLLPRLSENEAILLSAYEQLSAAVHAKQAISPAGEWLLDNFHLLQEQIRTSRAHLPSHYSRELPHLASGKSKGEIPRVYDLALEVIAHVDGRVDYENITTFVDSYQKVTQLKLGELWAIPIMLRLALLENLRRVAARVMIAMNDRSKARDWSELMLQVADHEPKNLILVVADMARSNPPMSNAFVAELVRNLQGHSPAMDVPLTWIAHQLAEMGQSIAQTVQLENQQQAANQVSVSSSIGSLRFLSATNWQVFVEQLSSVEQELRLDPANIYHRMAFATRDQYRHVIERLSRQSGLIESEVARTAIRLATSNLGSAKLDQRRSHVGYYLIGAGLNELRASLPKHSKIRLKLRFIEQALPFALFLGSNCLITVAISAVILAHHASPAMGSLTWIMLFALTLIATSQLANVLTNWLVTTVKGPEMLPRMDFSKGIPEEFRTLVAVPSMLISPGNIEDLLAALEVRYLANRDSNLYFGLLTDFVDAQSQAMPSDTALCQAAIDGIKTLNTRYRSTRKQNETIFFLFHRPRLWNSKERVWMGYERKRGKLEALNSLLRGENLGPGRKEAAFSALVGDISLLQNVKYVITLDSDTNLPSETAHKLIGTMAHPLNVPVCNKALGRVTEGYSILQPRVAVSLPGAYRSWFVRLYGGDAGTDPYTRAVSDVYQDLFGEGSFIGKGIYDVDAFRTTLHSSLPENLILSHDLLEGCYTRCGLVSDILLYEEHPSRFSEDVKRRKRWIRGDWQIAFWLLPWVPGFDGKWRKNPLEGLAKWKIFDNLRRSLVPIAILSLLIEGWASLPDFWYPNKVVIALFLTPALLTIVAELFHKPSEIPLDSHLLAVFRAASQRLTQALLNLVFLAFDAATNLEAIARSLFRILITNTHLLEWQSSTDPRNNSGSGMLQFYKSMWSAPTLAVTIGAFLLQTPHAITAALPFLIFWLLSPAIAFLLSRHEPDVDHKLSSIQIDYLHRLARKTWRFFETFVGPEDNWLPPDNFQEYPEPVVAHRTSPTNIGLSLLANLTAYDFGYISAPMLLDRTAKTFSTMEKMERFRGHFYNWYDTRTLAPLSPHYVSTVDSGNLTGFLLTLSPGLKSLANLPLVPPQAFSGLRDTIESLIHGSIISKTVTSHLTTLQSQLKVLPSHFTEILEVLRSLKQYVREQRDQLPMSADRASESSTWGVSSVEDQGTDCLAAILEDFAPWCLLSKPPADLWENPPFDLDRIPSFMEVSRLAERVLPVIDARLARECSDEGRSWLGLFRDTVECGSRRATAMIVFSENLAEKSEVLARFEYDFLYDQSRHLLAIGYNASEHRRDDSFYDLLASEARLCSFIAIAQGHLPQEHWFALGRTLTSWKSESMLISWSGSMFEYLMPLLVMPTFSHTILDQTYRTAVSRQIEYGKQRKVPWGISESGYNATDIHFNYQYRAFGVPGLGLKRGLADDLVIAPYAGMMALMIAPLAACTNLMRMTELGYEGQFGFFEAIDFTASRVSPENNVIIKSFMAHHQGMGFLSLAYLLLDRKMPKRFQTIPEFQAAELLLHERVPKTTTIILRPPEVSEAVQTKDPQQALLRIIHSANTVWPEVQLLSNGRYTVMITNAGGGYSHWKDLAITRWREDPTCDNWGTFCYVRDIESGKVWSASHQPMLTQPTEYVAIFPKAKAEFRRCDDELEMHTEVAVSPEDDIELRRFSIINRSGRRRIIELTSYAEVVLTSPAADDAHPAFSNLFIQTQILAAKQAILCTRRPRSAGEAAPTMVHLMSAHDSILGELSYETDRSKFIGRGRTAANPLAMTEVATEEQTPLSSQSLSGTDGSVLDPIVAIRCRIAIEPEQTVKLHVVTGIGETSESALGLIEKYRDRHLADRVFELAWTHQQVTLRQSNLTESEAQQYCKLASSLLYTNSSKRADAAIVAKNRCGQSGLWGYGISGDLAILLLKISRDDNLDILRQLIQAHKYWRQMGLVTELVLWVEDDSGYRQALLEQIMVLITTGEVLNQVDQRGGLFVLRAEQMSEEDRILLQTVARVMITGSGGTLAEQIERRVRSLPSVTSLIPTRALTPPKIKGAVNQQTTKDSLLFPNQFGGFTPDGREYQITTSPDAVTPAPWVNILANPYFGSVISESGSAYTWCENAHEFRLTPWHNDALCDNSGEAFYLRDEESGEFWSPTPLPVRGHSPYITNHGFGYSKFQHENIGIASEMTTFVAIDAPVKMTMIKIRNVSLRTRRISVTGYCEWVLGELRAKSLLHITTVIDPKTGAIYARNPFHAEFGARVAFFDVSERIRTASGDRSEFLGRNGRLAAPDAMSKARLSGRVGPALDSCAALQTVIEIKSGCEHVLSFTLGVGRDDDDVHTLIRRFASPSAASLALEEVVEFWEQTLSAVHVKTPDPAIDLLTNGWLAYQVLACRIWARSGHYQSGGAFGFRDQLQDAMALLHTTPNLLRMHLLRCAARQFREGDVQHWWHPPSGRGVRTHFSDDYLWLPLATCRYVLGTGDIGVLDVRVEFIEGREVKPDEEGYIDIPRRSNETATLYEHCVRAINRGLKFGKNGLPLMGCGDWNDGMNLVGQRGKGESVWLAFFLYDILTQFSKVAELRGDRAFLEKCQSHAAQLSENIEKNAWDGKWYRRAYFDNGSPLGSASNSECQIDSLPQSWAVLSGAGTLERSREAMAAVSERLIDRKDRLVKLFDPPFDHSDLNPGYIKGYVPGVRENGGQYTHAAIWTAMAFAALGDKKQAWEIFEIMNPINHAATPAGLAIYKVEPYVIAADVYAVPPHAGRGGWTWYTGSAGWMYRFIFESLLGVRLEVDRLYFNPCVPDHWQEFQIRYRFRRTFFNIVLKCARESDEKGSIVADGKKQIEAGLFLQDDLEEHNVEVYY
jgi:cyclic beta-1,2-glucan synthetase